jgi:hypothetical protein
VSAEGRTAALAVRLLGSSSSEFRLHFNVESDLVKMRISERLSSHEAMEIIGRYESGQHGAREERFSHTEMGRVAILTLTVLSPATRILKQAVAPACAQGVCQSWDSIARSEATVRLTVGQAEMPHTLRYECPCMPAVC